MRAIPPKPASRFICATVSVSIPKKEHPIILPHELLDMEIDVAPRNPKEQAHGYGTQRDKHIAVYPRSSLPILRR
jgi:hypothetical protein